MWQAFFDGTSNLTDMPNMVIHTLYIKWVCACACICVHVGHAPWVLWINNDVMEMVLAICHKEAAMRQLLAPINTVWEKCDDRTKFNDAWGVWVCVCVCVSVWVHVYVCVSLLSLAPCSCHLAWFPHLSLFSQSYTASVCVCVCVSIAYL